MTPIIAVFMSMISLLALVADRANLQEQTLSVQGEAIPLPSVDDGVSRNFLDVAKRTLPLKMTPTRSINLRRVPRAVPGVPRPGPRSPVPVSLTLVALAPAPDLDEGVRDGVRDSVRLQEPDLLKSLLVRALRKRDVRDKEPGEASKTPTSSTSAPREAKAKRARPSASLGPATRPAAHRPPRPPRPNSLGDLKEDLMAHGRDREQLRRRWKIQSAKDRMASVHG